MTDDHAANELELYVDNDASLYRSMTTPIHRNLVTKRARGEYKHDLAVKAFGHLMEAGAKKYAKEFGGTWNQMFSPRARREAAERFTRSFETEADLGNYDHLLPKKYQKKTSTVHATKKRSPAQLQREINEFLAKEPGSSGPRVLKVSSGKTFAAQRSITATVQYPGEKPSRVEFVGPSASIGGPGPVVLITESGLQTRVTDPSRFGDFGPDWVRRFFEGVA